MSTETDYNNLYWAQVNKRKELEREMHLEKSSLIREVNNLGIKNKELMNRISVLEKKKMFGEIIKKNSVFYIIECDDDIGEFSIHKSKLNGIEFCEENVEKRCTFNIYYTHNKYNIKNLVLVL